MKKVETSDLQKSNSNSRRKYWQSLEERTSPEKPVWNSQEFPMDKHQMEEESQKLSLNRKDFLKFMGAGAVMVNAACRRPTEQIIPAVIQPPEIVPGVPVFYSTTAPDGTGLIVRTREGRPIKIAGNPDHPLTRGGVSAWNVASLMDLYDPDRLRKAAKIKDGRKIRYPEAGIIAESQAKIKKGKYAILSGPIDSPASRALFTAFLEKNPGGKLVEIRQDPTLRQIAEGQKASYGTSLIPYYRFDRADYIVSIDGDFLGTMIAPSVFTAAYSAQRELRAGGLKMNRLVMFESMYSVTGSNADNRIPIKPGDQAVVALCLASHIVLGMGESAMAGNGAVKKILEAYAPQKAASILGVNPGDLEKIARELWENRGKSLVVGASPLCATGSNTAVQAALNLLNSILENDGKTIDYSHPLLLSAGVSDMDLKEVFEEIRSGAIKTVILAGANPLYHLPSQLNAGEALKKAEHILSLNDRIDESSLLAHAILPSSHFLESWGDSELIKGILSIRQPVIRPLYETAGIEDRLIQLSGGEINGHKTFHDFMKNRWSAYSGGEFRTFWQSALQGGYFAPGRGALSGAAAGRNFNTSSLDALPASPAAVSVASDEAVLGLYYNNQVLDGSGANNAYRQELPDPVTKCVWQNYISISPSRARELKFKQGTVVEVKHQNKTIALPVHLQPGLHPQAVLIALGYGRKSAGIVADGVGVNALDLVASGSDSFVFSSAKVKLTSTGDRVDLPNTQTIYRTGYNTEDRAFFAIGSMPDAPLSGSSQLEGRPIIREQTLEEFIKKPGELKPEGIEYSDKVAIMPTWQYKDLRWHMVIDLNQCTGCGACVTSCNTENNIPSVGPDEVNRGREMHWLRIDRYFSGGEDRPEVSHQPMLCQQCENAPCENVCPVAATTHNSEGLNVMTYNRCVGTRYCANNCPYKVRRFNWFENWYYMEGFDRKIRDPQHLALNPDVNVRVRGVMEKCTFCIHRIASARQEMKARGDVRMRDGSIITACQEVCPSQAISFGDINDPESRVSKLAKSDKRAYKVLDFLGVKPSVTYLAKIRNKA